MTRHFIQILSLARRYLALLLGTVLLPLNAGASIVVNGTRLVYPAAEREITVKLENDGKSASLVQVWLDDGDPKKNAADINLPFLITPPVARVDTGKSQTIRMMFAGAPIEGDKELVYWFNVLDIPAGATDTGENKLKLAFRTRIKLFYRPSGLKGSVDDAPQSLEWKREPDGLRVSNNSAYHVTFSSATLRGSNAQINFEERFMIKPGESWQLKTSGLQVKSGDALDIKIINDYGSITDIQAQVR
ncbi:fimbrial biogenesis chaperone [Achromobacter marplatensis]|uniref:fimbrial biogenesis chaperone n=1 Tax=Achromobacter marplatensis TaxID=470868 RepID=UPI0039F69D61